MNKNIFTKKIFAALCLCIVSITVLLLITSFSPNNEKRSSGTGTLKITFINTANGKPVVLRDSMYTNYFGEQYSISKLKYYISNISLTSNQSIKNMGGYYLMNAATGENSFEMTVEAGNYRSLEFLLGIDSIRNCSGAQTGALDPMNDMFWTWNSGYVIFKMEGTSAASTADLQRIEHHIGGYKAANNVSTKISFNFITAQILTVKENTTTEIFIETNLDKYWHSNTDIKIAELPVCTMAGEQAKKIAANFVNLFSIKKIRFYP